MNVEPENDYFARLVIALDPWLDQVVIIGGCPRAQALALDLVSKGQNRSNSRLDGIWLLAPV